MRNYVSIWWQCTIEIRPGAYMYRMGYVNMFDAQPNDKNEEIYENMEFRDAIPYEGFIDVGEWSDED